MKTWKAVLLLTALCVAFLWLLFGNVLLHPGQYMFGYLEDGTKNYYTAAYFIKYNHGLWFTGMNYPFGEHVTYTDSQPLFAVILSYIQHHITPVAAYTIGLFNGFMLFGIVACAVFLYLIMAELKLPVWYAIATAIIIAFLSPQLFRIRAHYALGYTFIIPMCWYFILKIFQQPRHWFLYLIYAVAGLLAVLVHPYYALINLLFLAAYLLVYYFQEKKQRKINYRLLGGLLAAVIIPLFVFQLYMIFTDPVTDRPESPYGFTAYRTSFKALFFPLEAPLLPYWQAIFGTKEVIWEGYAYVGQAAFIVFVLTLIKFIKYALRKRWKLIFRPALPAPLRVGLWAAVLVLLFALAIPIKWGLEGILDVVPPLKQFRSIGRFAWIFYYIFSVYAAYYWYRLYRKFRLQSKPTLAWLILLLPLGFWAFEGFNNVYQKAITIKNNHVTAAFTGDPGNYTELLAKHQLRPADFQAILPLPYFNVGSEKITIFRNAESANEAMKASLNTGLPIATALLSRTSLSQCLQQLQLLSSPFIPKEILTKYPNRKPLLLLVIPDSLTNAEAMLVKKARLIAQQPTFNLYQLSLDSLQAAPNDKTPNILPAGLQKQGSVFISEAGGTVIRKNYADGDLENGLFQKGALALKERETILIDTLLHIPAGGQTYEFSGWASALSKNLPQIKFTLETPDGQIQKEEAIFFNATTEILHKWLFSSYTVKIPAGQYRVRFITKTRHALLDDLLLRPISTDVFFFNAQKALIKNNRQAAY